MDDLIPFLLSLQRGSREALVLKESQRSPHEIERLTIPQHVVDNQLAHIAYCCGGGNNNVIDDTSSSSSLSLSLNHQKVFGLKMLSTVITKMLSPPSPSPLIFPPPLPLPHADIDILKGIIRNVFPVPSSFTLFDTSSTYQDAFPSPSSPTALSATLPPSLLNGKYVISLPLDIRNTTMDMIKSICQCVYNQQVNIYLPQSNKHSKSDLTDNPPFIPLLLLRLSSFLLYHLSHVIHVSDDGLDTNENSKYWRELMDVNEEIIKMIGRIHNAYYTHYQKNNSKDNKDNNILTTPSFLSLDHYLRSLIDFSIRLVDVSKGPSTPCRLIGSHIITNILTYVHNIPLSLPSSTSPSASSPHYYLITHYLLPLCQDPSHHIRLYLSQALSPLLSSLSSISLSSPSLSPSSLSSLLPLCLKEISELMSDDHPLVVSNMVSSSIQHILPSLSPLLSITHLLPSYISLLSSLTEHVESSSYLTVPTHKYSKRSVLLYCIRDWGYLLSHFIYYFHGKDTHYPMKQKYLETFLSFYRIMVSSHSSSYKNQNDRVDPTILHYLSYNYPAYQLYCMIDWIYYLHGGGGMSSGEGEKILRETISVAMMTMTKTEGGEKENSSLSALSSLRYNGTKFQTECLPSLMLLLNIQNTFGSTATNSMPNGIATSLSSSSSPSVPSSSSPSPLLLPAPSSLPLSSHSHSLLPTTESLTLSLRSLSLPYLIPIIRMLKSDAYRFTSPLIIPMIQQGMAMNLSLLSSSSSSSSSMSLSSFQMTGMSLSPYSSSSSSLYPPLLSSSPATSIEDIPPPPSPFDYKCVLLTHLPNILNEYCQSLLSPSSPSLSLPFPSSLIDFFSSLPPLLLSCCTEVRHSYRYQMIVFDTFLRIIQNAHHYHHITPFPPLSSLLTPDTIDLLHQQLLSLLPSTAHVVRSTLFRLYFAATQYMLRNANTYQSMSSNGNNNTLPPLSSFDLPLSSSTPLAPLSMDPLVITQKSMDSLYKLNQFISYGKLHITHRSLLFISLPHFLSYFSYKLCRKIYFSSLSSISVDPHLPLSLRSLLFVFLYNYPQVIWRLSWNVESRGWEMGVVGMWEKVVSKVEKEREKEEKMREEEKGSGNSGNHVGAEVTTDSENENKEIVVMNRIKSFLSHVQSSALSSTPPPSPFLDKSFITEEIFRMKTENPKENQNPRDKDGIPKEKHLPRSLSSLSSPLSPLSPLFSPSQCQWIYFPILHFWIHCPPHQSSLSPIIRWEESEEVSSITIAYVSE